MLYLNSVYICVLKFIFQTHPTLCSFIQYNCEARNNEDEERVLVHIKSCHERSPQFTLKVLTEIERKVT